MSQTVFLCVVLFVLFVFPRRFFGCCGLACPVGCLPGPGWPSAGCELACPVGCLADCMVWACLAHCLLLAAMCGYMVAYVNMC